MELEQGGEDFWQNQARAFQVNKRLAALKRDTLMFKDVSKRVEEAFLLIEDDEMLEILDSEIKDLQKQINILEEETLFSGEYDSLNCYLEIHPGAGGTESCDWADMLLRMYLRFCEKEDFKYEEIEYGKGDEAGLKSVTVKIMGMNAYGLLKLENGVHRLVRISPFDSNKRRHTSFAAVTVIPEFDTDVNIDIREEDLKIDVYHSSGAGGQSVNTSNSAVRITHLPTKTVVVCQNERSQLKNKEQAMKILRNKLYLLELESKNKQIQDMKNTDIAINFGSQIRSYVMEPYKMVKEHRSSFESSDPEKILDGDIKELLLFNLKMVKNDGQS